MLQTFNVVAGGRQIDAKANYFRYESRGLSGLNETISVRADGNDLGTYLPGDAIELPITASRWEIVPAAPLQTVVVRLGVGKISSTRLLGNVRVIDEITDAITYNSNAVSTAIQTITWQPIVDPILNVRGIMLRGYSVSGVPGTGGSLNMQVAVAKSLPVAFTVPAQKWTVTGIASSSGGVTLAGSNNLMNKFLPPGFGIYFGWEILTVAAAVQPSYGVSYELL